MPSTTTTASTNETSDRLCPQEPLQLQRQKEIKSECESIHACLRSQDYTQALLLGTQTLRKALDYYGKSSYDVLLCYLLIAESYLGQNRLRQTEEYLSLANWNIVQGNEALYNIEKGQIMKIYGKMMINQQRYKEALSQLAEAAYFTALECGPENIRAAAIYYHMGIAFYRSDNLENALALYDKVVDIWYKFMASVKEVTHNTERIDANITHEAMDILQSILTTRIRTLGETHIAAAEARYTLSLLHLYTGKYADAKIGVNEALEVYIEHLGQDHPSTKDVASVLEQLQARQ